MNPSSRPKELVPGGGLLRHLLSKWTWQMAWRDSRTGRGRLALFSCSIVLGIAALAGVASLGHNLARAVEEQTKSLLGADLVVSSRDAFTPEQEEWLSTLGGEQAHETSFSSMVYFPKTQDTRLVQIRALGAGFPFYGKFDTDPFGAADEFRMAGGALVDDSLLRQFDARPGDKVRVGKLETVILGRLLKVPGETIALSTIAPRVYIPMEDLPRSGLLQGASLAQYRVYFRFPTGIDVDTLLEHIRPQLEKFRFGHDTVSQRKRELGRSMDNLYHFLGLVGFVALLLGSVGVASAIHIHVKQKLGTVAVLRCLGGSVPQTFSVYLAQGIALGVFGAVVGGSLGIAIQGLLPGVLADFIPFSIRFHIAWLAIGEAVGTGFSICILFALLPLLSIRRVSPLAALRVSFEPSRGRHDPVRWLVGSFLVAIVFGFTLMQTRNWRVALGFEAGLLVVFAALTVVAAGLAAAARRARLDLLPFAVRQGIANLHRPNNRTLLLLLSLGLGTFLMTNLYLVQQNLLSQLVGAGGEHQPNAVLFDVQTPQREGVLRILHSLSVPVLDTTPVVNMRLSAVKGRPVEDILSDTNRSRGEHRWAYRREYRSTYRDTLRDGERIVAGRWIGTVTNATGVGEGAAEAVPISIEQGIAKELRVDLGDTLLFDVQGVPVLTRVASVRTVEWRRIQPNFFVVFPRGALETAPAMHVFVLRVSSSDESARVQREMIKAFPNVSAIDLTLVLKTIDSILGKITFVIRFMHLFTLLTGFVVMVTALLTGRYQRVRETALLRTLGASRKQVLRILCVEYVALGALAAMTGVALAVGTAGLLARFLFHTSYAPPVPPLLVALAVVPAVTTVTGLFISRGILNHSPLEVLRAEG